MSYSQSKRLPNPKTSLISYKEPLIELERAMSLTWSSKNKGYLSLNSQGVLTWVYSIHTASFDFLEEKVVQDRTEVDNTEMGDERSWTPFLDYLSMYLTAEAWIYDIEQSRALKASITSMEEARLTGATVPAVGEDREDSVDWEEGSYHTADETGMVID